MNNKILKDSFKLGHDFTGTEGRLCHQCVSLVVTITSGSAKVIENGMMIGLYKSPWRTVMSDVGPVDNSRRHQAHMLEFTDEGESEGDDKASNDPFAEGGRERQLAPPRRPAVVAIVPYQLARV